MTAHMPSTEEELRVFRDAIQSMPTEMVYEVASSFSVRELDILAEEDRFAEFAHGVLFSRALALVERFKLPALATFEMMDTEDTVMSGSAALSITAPGMWSPADIDFYCPEGKLGAVVAFLTAFEYEVVPWPRRTGAGGTEGPSSLTANGTPAHIASQDVPADADSDNGGEDADPVIDFNPYARHVMKTVVLLKHKHEGCMINVIESIVPCAEAPVFAFHSTIVMNVITSRGAICYYPQWTFYNKGVVNRPEGLAGWNPRGEEKEQNALAKYRARGYSIASDCVELHEGQEACAACRPGMRKWSDGLSMTFRRGDSFGPSSRPFRWRLGAQPREKEDMFWMDRGLLIVLQGDGDGRAIVYDGLAKKKKRMTAASLREIM